MNEQTGFAVTALWIYPTKDKPGVSLPSVKLEAEGLAGIAVRRPPCTWSARSKPPSRSRVPT